MEIYIPEFFGPEELVNKTVYEMFEDNPEMIFRLFDPNILKGADWLRKNYGPMTINDWFWGGNYDDSGLRYVGVECYNKYSQHSVGKALDPKPKNYTAEEVRQDIKRRVATGDIIPYITRIEEKVSWLHIDTKGEHTGKPYFFNP